MPAPTVTIALPVFEYRVLRLSHNSDTSEDQETLNIYGKDGWEIVSVCPQMIPDAGGPVAYLKRQKSA
jgi:hypothetical protein